MKPAAQRRVAEYLRKHHKLSQRPARRLARVHRSKARYRSIRAKDEPIHARLRELALAHRHYGYKRLHVLLRREGILINHKRTYRPYREERLMVQQRRKRW